MTAIAGIVEFEPGSAPAGACRALLSFQAEFGPHRVDCDSDGTAQMGRCLFRRFPEDQFDVQPVRTPRARMLVGDVRLDNRSEVCAALGLAPVEARRVADSTLIMRAWERWGEASFDRVAGSYAIALWDPTDRRLTLARDPFGHCPLHVATGRGWVAFASMPQALRLLPGVDGSPDLISLGAFVADAPRVGQASFFNGIERIEPGHALAVTPTGRRYWKHWEPKPETLPASAAHDVEAFRFRLDQAVEAGLRGAGERVSSQLSGGWDSAAVTATAAMHMAPARLVALTAAPPTGFDGPVPAGRLADEGQTAAAVALGHANIDHRIIRDRSERPLDLLADNNRLAGQPTGHVCNNQWWTALGRAAADERATVMLTAEMGNHTLSAGGGMQLADLVRAGRLSAWLDESRGLKARQAMRWTGILDQSFGPFVPFYRYLRPLLIGDRAQGALDLVAPHLRAPVRERLRQSPPVLPSNSRAHRQAMLGEQDSGVFRKTTLARFGIDERDPTSERRLVEYCLSLPPSALLAGGERRPLAAAALADRLPHAVLAQCGRGLQFADWFRWISADEVGERLAAEGVGEVIDLSAASTLVARWPRSGFDQLGVARRYRMDLMRAVSAASFLNTYRTSDPRAAQSRFDSNFLEGTPANSRPGKAGVV